MLGRINVETFWFGCPDFSDVLVRSQALERFQSSGKIVGHQEGLQVSFQLLMRLIVVAFYGRVLDRPIHALHLTISPEMFWLSMPMLNAKAVATKVEHVPDVARSDAIPVFGLYAKLSAVVRQYGMNLVRNCSNKPF